MTDQLAFEFETASGAVDPATVRVTRLAGREEISRCYEYEVDLVVDLDGGLGDDALEDLLRMPCRVFYGPSHLRAYVHGVLSSIQTLTTSAPQPIVYRATLVPKLWITSQTRRSRVFQDLDAPGIARAVFEELGLEEERDFVFSLAKTYPTSEYTVQYQESDLAFVQRQLEHHGIFFSFEQEESGERIVVGDTNDAFEELEDRAQLAYTPGEEAEMSGVMALSRMLTPRPAGVLLRDYNWRTPSVGLQADAPADTTTGRGFFNEYAQHFKDQGEGSALATVRAEELMATRDVFEGTCRVPGLAPGHRFELTGHPLAELDQEYVVTGVRQEVTGSIEGTGSAGLIKHFTAIPKDVPYRPDRRTPKPKIEGIMHAKIDGEVPGTAAPIDQYGRYKVLFPFDLVAEGGGKASRWVRFAQASSGPGYGIHFPLHIGVEVAVAHLDGDPDRPIIMASPPNAETITPVNDQNATQSEIVTKTGIRMTWDDDA